MKLVLTTKAETDLDEIAAYLFARNPSGARNVEAALAAAFDLLARYPEAGAQRRRGVRRFPLPGYPYLIFYRVDETIDEITVFTIRHAARRTWPGERDLEAP